jgi:hypothetical protein
MNKKPTEIERLLGRSNDYYSLSAQDQWEQDKTNGILDWDGSDEHAMEFMKDNLQSIKSETILAIMRKQQYNQTYFKDIFREIRNLMEFKYPNAEQQQGAQKALMIIENYLLNREIP